MRFASGRVVPLLTIVACLQTAVQQTCLLLWAAACASQPAPPTTEEDDAASLLWLVNSNPGAEALSTWIGTRPCTDGKPSLAITRTSWTKLLEIWLG
jgi:hypothetical protein